MMAGAALRFFRRGGGPFALRAGFRCGRAGRFFKQECGPAGYFVHRIHLPRMYETPRITKFPFIMSAIRAARAG